MKRLSLLLCLFMLAACSGGNTGSNSGESGEDTSDTSETSGDTSDTSEEDPEEEVIEVKDGPILHAWDWSIKMVRDNLEDIKEAGYINVQLSPLHPSKSKSASGFWWNLYQPQGFKVAEGDENPLGDKEQLKALTKEAKDLGINIIMDVVTNHLGGSNDYTFDSAVATYEPTIYNQNLKHNNGQVDNWYNRRQLVTRAIGGYPDLQTDHSEVQKSVIRMLKEYIDCGVSGFRFDAAKHIETPNDESDIRSDFWPNVTNTIYTYGEDKLGFKPFVYGEVLDDACIGIDNYTKYMSVTDNRQGSDIRNGVNEKDVSRAASSHNNVGGMSHAVLWAESHDTFENKSRVTTNINTDVLNLTYAIQIARKDSTALYFARPSTNYQVDEAPQVISGPNDDYKSPLIAAANKFHCDFVGGSESISTSGSAVINVRKTDSNEGVLIADVNCGNNSVTVSVNGLSDGEYTNLIDNKKYTVNNETVTVNLTKGGCVLEKNESKGPKISITTEDNDNFFTSTTEVKVNVINSTSVTYSINGGEAKKINARQDITVGSGLAKGEITFTVTASNDGATTSKTIYLYKTDVGNKNFILYNVPTDEKIALWVWYDGKDGRWVPLTKDGNFRGESFNETHFLIGKFDQESDYSWDTIKKKTGDFYRLSNVTRIDYTQFIFN